MYKRQVADPTIRKRPPTPRNMSASVQSLMEDCIEEEAEKRPSFEELDIRLKRIDAEAADPNEGNKKNSTISLFDIFPRHIAEALRDGQTVEPEHRDSATIFFSGTFGSLPMGSVSTFGAVANLPFSVSIIGTNRHSWLYCDQFDTATTQDRWHVGSVVHKVRCAVT